MAAPTPSTVSDRLLMGSDIAVYYSAQTAKGAINATPEFQKYRRVSGKGMTKTNYIESAMIQADGQGKQQIRDRDEYSITLESELNKQGLEDFIRSLHSAAETIVGVTDTGFAAVSGGFQSTADFGSVEVGDYIWFSGFVATALNIGYRVVTKASSSAITTYPEPSTTEAAGATVTMTMRKSGTGVSQHYGTFQTRTLDESKASDLDYHTLYDAVTNNFSLEIPDSGIATYTMELMAESKVSGTAAISGQTDAADLTDDSISAVTNVTEFWIDGVTQLGEIKSLSLEVARNYQTDPAAGRDGFRTAMGDPAFTGSIAVNSMKSAPFTWRGYYENGTDISIGVKITHSDNTAHETVIIIRSAKVTECGMPDGSDTIANSECTFAAQKDSTTGSTIQVYRNWTN